MLTAILTFLGGATARLLLGHLFDFLTKWQDAKNELARLALQGELEAAAHARNIEALRVQADLGVKVIGAQIEAHQLAADDDAFVAAVRATGQKVGIVFVDVWNGIIRPLLATICIVLWIVALSERNWNLDEWDRSLISLALGIFVGGRIHVKGG